MVFRISIILLILLALGLGAFLILQQRDSTDDGKSANGSQEEKEKGEKDIRATANPNEASHSRPSRAAS